jgi:hypothetical protein
MLAAAAACPDWHPLWCLPPVQLPFELPPEKSKTSLKSMLSSKQTSG